MKYLIVILLITTSCGKPGVTKPDLGKKVYYQVRSQTGYGWIKDYTLSFVEISGGTNVESVSVIYRREEILVEIIK